MTAADRALVREREMAVGRGENWQRRTELRDGLTRERDGLHAALVDRSAERKLDRAWPDLFFRVIHRGSDTASLAPTEVSGVSGV